MLTRWLGNAQRAYEILHDEPMGKPAYIFSSDIPRSILACLDDPEMSAALEHRAAMLVKNIGKNTGEQFHHSEKGETKS